MTAGSAITAILRSAAALAVAYPVYVLALLYYGSRTYQPIIKVVGIGLALLGGYVAGLIGGRRRWPMVHAGVPAAIFPWLFSRELWDRYKSPPGEGELLSDVMASVLLTSAALLGGYLARPRAGRKQDAAVEPVPPVQP